MVSTPTVAAPPNAFVFIDTNSFSKDGRTINVGDCALFKPPHNSVPFVGRIRRLKLGKENSISLCVNWLYRPADVKLKEGASVEAAPNEVFYSFHKDEIPAASLLHPCKVTFLRKGVEFPSGVSSFVCRQVYDVETERLWWLTDKDYINELQEEVDQLLGKTLLEMHGGRSPKPLNRPNGSTKLKPVISSDNLQHSSSSISSHSKSKKREHGVRNSESVKRAKVDDADSGQARPEHILKTEIAKITDKGGLVDFGGVEKLIQLMRPPEKKLNLACRKMLVDVISDTDKIDCLGRFAYLKGLQVLDEWLQEIHKGKIGDGSPKEDDKSVEEFIFCLLGALDRLPVNLHALQTCNVGKSVNHLRSHRNSEIQKKARSLVSTWKRRVEAEMNMIETKSSTKKAPQPKESSGEAVTKSPTSAGSTKLSPSSATKEGRSCSLSQSPNNSQSCSSDHAKTSVSKLSSCVSHSKVSGNGFYGSRAQKEVGKVGRNIASEKGSPTRVSDVSLVDNGNRRRLILRLPNIGRSPTETASLESPENSSIISGKDSLPVPSSQQDRKVSGKIDSVQGNTNTNIKKKAGNDLSREKGPIVRDEEHCKKDASFASGSSSGVTPKLDKLYEPSYSSINALVESCAKFSEASVFPSFGDDGGINLLASVAAAEMSPACSPDCNSRAPEDLCSANVSVANGHVLVEQIGSVDRDDSNTGSVIMAPEVKPAGLIEDATNMKPNSKSALEEDKCPDDKPIRDTVVLLNATATSIKPDTKQINEEPASWSSSDLRDVDLASNSEEDDDRMAHLNMDSRTSVSEHAYENIEKDNKAPVAARQEDRTATDVTEVNCVEDRTVKLDFDLNEVFPNDDGMQCDVETASVHVSPSNSKTLSGLFTAAKGPFYPSESFSSGKPELGWKGSAATSAFRPAEPRKVDAPFPDNHTSKPAHTPFDFDLNVGVDDVGQHNAPSGSGLHLDLNACEESPEAVQLSVSTSGRPSMSALTGGPNYLRDFDLNGPGKEEVVGESVTFSKNGLQFISGVPNVRMNNMDTGSFSTWFPPNNTYPAISIPSQRLLTPVSSSSSLNPEIFRGPVLSSSPAVALSSTMPFQYSAFPFGTNSSASAGGPLCFPTIPSMGPNGVISMPYFMSPPGGSPNVGPDGRMWGSQSLDPNTGPGFDKLPTTLRQLPLGSADEQLRMFQQITTSKRKQPDSGLDGYNRISYKYPHQQ